MATFQVNKQNNNNGKKNVKMIVGWVLLALSTLVFLFSDKLDSCIAIFFLGDTRNFCLSTHCPRVYYCTSTS